MLTIQECKKYLDEYDVTDEEVRQFRDGWYGIINELIDDYLGKRNEEKNG